MAPGKDDKTAIIGTVRHRPGTSDPMVKIRWRGGAHFQVRAVHMHVTHTLWVLARTPEPVSPR